MPMERERYPSDWEQIATAKKESVGWKCERCGKQCRKPGEPFDTHKRTLTVAHLNHTPEDVRPENLMAMCAPCHLKYDALTLLKAKEPRWISVKDRLPENDDKVLCCTRTAKGIQNIIIGYYMGGMWRCGMNSNVTHWMPLPEPPKEG